MTDRRYDRRTVLKSALAGLAALPAAGSWCSRRRPPHLDEKEQLAVAMGYVHDARKSTRTRCRSTRRARTARTVCS